MLHTFNLTLKISYPSIGGNYKQTIKPQIFTWTICLLRWSKTLNKVKLFYKIWKINNKISSQLCNCLKSKKDSLSILMNLHKNKISFKRNKKLGHLKSKEKSNNLRIRYWEKEMQYKQEFGLNTNHKRKSSINCHKENKITQISSKNKLTLIWNFWITVWKTKINKKIITWRESFHFNLKNDQLLSINRSVWNDFNNLLFLKIVEIKF